ncbi:hypothetical protein VOLCADRAFT_115858 [Volvox carteri f. nagariensis]|uniref:Protein kinase domain-containing protein n=1 Tax=Volvox carteri f. nagariensis TaxID=3068 RepID=D8TIR0_VOLCA|nr:uncharacterized protein VOLCADRAFT_115858 [Volvox carteri f. nagariensis]EFJ53286.1 hypothetical protein VOLCADRAFT_115858 [Volvox carteri f. nagariensis]|eukprot:XP_002946291.1 hypothetical protein VOLCADRAFT_115858 [Volvox carteri f. nagariensis]
MKQTTGICAGSERRRLLPRHAKGVWSRSSVTRCRAFPDAEDVAKAVSSLPLPPRVSELLTDSDAWSGLEPHFGSRALAGAVSSLAARAPHVSLPSPPSLELSTAVNNALKPFRGAAAGLSATAQYNLRLDLLPSSPEIAAASTTGGDSGGYAISGLEALSHTFSQGFEAASAAAGVGASQATAALAASGDLGRGLAAAAEALAAVAATATAAAGSGGSELQPHFGTATVVRGVEALASWVGSRFDGLELLDPITAASLTSALSELRGVAGVMTLPPALGAAGSSTLQQLGATASALAAGLGSLLDRGGEAALAAAAAPDALLGSLTTIYQQAQEGGVGGHSLPTVALAATMTLLAVAASTPDETYTGPEYPYEAAAGGGGSDELTHEYDPEAVAAYFSRRPLAVAASFGAALLVDLWTGRLEVNERRRAEQLRGVVERLGPASPPSRTPFGQFYLCYVKVAQALSTRVDLLTPAYFEQVQMLQDRVPPFPCEVARKEMEKAFGGRPVEAVFSQLSERPVAAASLGQVYRGTLRPELGGGDVAVKVQRPGVLEQVALDLLIMRRLAIQMKEKLQMNTDWAGVIDAWAVRFFHELDYRREAANAALFRQQMAAAGVEGVVVAAVRSDLSTDYVLTTDWVEGEKLSESNAADVRELCNTLLNAYLIQLLDTGFLHADPHPGNLIRTPEGRICVLDFGLMTEVTPEQRLALVEYIAHLSTQDWEKLAVDLQTLGFIPPSVDPREAGLVEPLGRVMSQLVGGGGAAKVNIDKVTGDLEELGNQYPIQVPPFFALILRAFSVIEGIALRVDPNYAIVAECFPYLARRLLNDDSPRMRAVLRDILYGGKQHMDVERLIRVADGLSAFTTDGLAVTAGPAAAAAAAGSGVGGGGTATATAAAGGVAPRPATAMAVATTADEVVLSPVVVETLRSVLRPGSYISELLVEELVAAVDALSRESLSRLVRGVLLSAPAAMSLRGVEALGPLRSVLLPLPTPVEVLARMAPAVAVTPEDQEALGVVRAILMLSQRLAQSEAAAERAQAQAAAAAASRIPPTQQQLQLQSLPQQQQQQQALLAQVRARRAARLANELSALLPDLAPGLAYSSDLFVRALVRRVSARVTDAAWLATGRRAGVQDAAATVPAPAALPQPAIAMRMMAVPGSDVGDRVQGQAGAARRR